MQQRDKLDLHIQCEEEFDKISVCLIGKGQAFSKKQYLVAFEFFGSAGLLSGEDVDAFYSEVFGKPYRYLSPYEQYANTIRTGPIRMDRAAREANLTLSEWHVSNGNLAIEDAFSRAVIRTENSTSRISHTLIF